MKFRMDNHGKQSKEKGAAVVTIEMQSLSLLKAFICSFSM